MFAILVGSTFLALLPQTETARAPRLVLEPDREARDRAGGGSQSFQIDSALLGQRRRVFVHVPASFARSGEGRRYPTMVVFDGAWMLRSVVLASELLAEQGQVPESVVVAIENTDDYDGRVHDLTPPGLSVSGSGLEEGGDRFLDFVEKELLPALDEKFRTSGPRALIGTSNGGILVTHAAATRDTFRFTLSLDTPTHLGDGWLGKKFLQRAKAATGALRYASIDARFGWSDAEWKRLTAAAPPSWRLHREKLVHESHTSMQFLGSYLGLRELFQDYSILATSELPTTSILPSYAKLTASYGAPVVPPEPLLRQVLDDLLMEGRGAEARAALDLLSSSYGEPRDAETLRERVADVERSPPPAETVEGLLATLFPTVEQARAYLGEWEGETWVNPVAKHRFGLRIAVEGDKVVGAMRSWPAPDVELTRPLQYLKVTPEGLDFGDMNGMRPRGLLLHEGRREGDRLTGTVRFGGIRFVSPDGHVPAVHHFTLRKTGR